MYMYLNHAGIIHAEPSNIDEVLNLIKSGSVYTFCPGLQPQWYEDKIGVVRFHRKVFVWLSIQLRGMSR